MPEQPNVSPVRGMRDLLPAECELRDWAVGRILDVYRRFGFARIETPVLEHLALLTGGQGGENEKLIFKVLKRGEDLDRAATELSARGSVKSHGTARAATNPALSPTSDSDSSAEDHRTRGTHDSPGLAHGQATASAQGDVLTPRGELKLDNVLADSGLRFDLTVPLARYYAANQGALPQPFKAIQIGPVFRAERPQKGRFRQFTQCDIDILGEAGHIAEVELILATAQALAALGLAGFTVKINDRRILEAYVEQHGVSPEKRSAVFVALDKVDKVGWPGVATELALAGAPASLIEALWRHFDPAKKPATPTSIEVLHGLLGAPESLLGEAHPMVRARTYAAELMRIEEATRAPLAAQGATVQYDFSLVRGMGYYTGPIFEISMEGAPGSIAGGGRYDRMIGRMLGREVPACGFSIGFERVIGLLVERGFKPPKSATRFALVYEPETDGLARVMAEAANCRSEGNTVAVFARRKKFGKQLDELEKAGFDCVLTLPPGNGEPEKKWLGGAQG
jgi:histidyl-tRNA synthetase